ncbi:MAG: type I restriction endonuclease subunit R [Enterococcus sp.]
MPETEAQLEERLMKHLHKLNYQRVAIHDEEAMVQNLRQILNQRNQAKLNGVDLTDREFQTVLTKLTSSSIYETARILRDGTLTLEREDSSQPVLYLNYFDSHPANNIYQVTNQITIHGKAENRYDVTLLVNGLPLVQIELKKSGVEIAEAFNQIMRYRQFTYTHSKYNLFKFVQMFVVSNRMNTRYFANNAGELNANFMFLWANEDNQGINDIYEFSNSLLNLDRLHSMIARYTIFDEANKMMLLMRPYQVYAAERLVHQALTTNKNGYIWHTTGSGKTLTSFKAAQLLAKEESIGKVIFLLDRADLNKQTTDNFKSYAEIDDLLNGTDSTNDLVRQLTSNQANLIITTIQKMNHAVKRHEQALQRIQGQKIVFIVDEAHRSQFGKQQMEISNYFPQAQWFGFTGTPRFKSNPAADKRTTDDIFHELLHSYLINDAIRDGNVLGFQVDYMKTMKLDTGNYLEDEDVAQIDTEELYTSDERLEIVVGDILKHHQTKTKHGKYCAMFTVPSTKLAVRYYDEFQKQVAAKQLDLRVATVFTWAANEEGNENDQEMTHSMGQMKRIVNDYNETYQTNFAIDDFASYAADIGERLKKNLPKQNIDLLIVVNMMLTGFDAKKLNTLYIDKNMEYHNLMQAFSRTNRVETKDKPFGQIVAYRNLKQKTDDALKLFGNTDEVSLMLQPPYQEIKEKFAEAVAHLISKIHEPQAVDQLEGEEAQWQFVAAFRNINRLLTRMEGYGQFGWDDIKQNLGFSEQTYNDYRSKYLDLYRELQTKTDKTSVLHLVDFEIELAQRDLINVDYILQLIRNLSSNQNQRQTEIAAIKESLHNSGDLNLRSKMELLLKFLDTIVPQLTEDADIEIELGKFAEAEKQEELTQYAVANDIELQAIMETAGKYEFSQLETIEYLKPVIKGAFPVKRKKTANAINFIIETVKKYTLGL